MNDIDPKPKRKNDDKAKRRPGLRMAAAAILIGMFLGVTGLLALLRPTPVPFPQYPTARLYYTSDGQPYTLSLQTGKRYEAEPLSVLIHPDDPTDILAAQALIESDQHKPFEASPNGEWLGGWKHIRDYYQWELMLYDRLGQGRSRALGVFQGLHWGVRINWSPDSQFITFSANIPPPSGEIMNMHTQELWLVSLPTGGPVRLTTNTFREATPSFSPDATQIVYTSEESGSPRLYIMDLATGESRLILSEVFGYSPTWSPDGQWIAFTTNQFSYRNDTSDIWIVRPDGTDVQSVIDGEQDDVAPIWLP